QAARSGEPLAALLLDLDHFKQINDTFGHGSGDDVLAAAATILEATIRASDFAGRYGGEEFVVLLPATGHDEAKVVAEKIRAAIEGLGVPGVDRKVTTSIGIAVLPLDAAEGTTLIRQADRALYSAKRSGRNRVVLARDHLDGTQPGEMPTDRSSDVASIARASV
ncbi:MAG: hypothetical protein QOJ85_1924, partial [Solirubrobacteraceae bacterium]|nr:hypothetical protein [Solirubrobacteraceae bacterium]